MAYCKVTIVARRSAVRVLVFIPYWVLNIAIFVLRIPGTSTRRVLGAAGLAIQVPVRINTGSPSTYYLIMQYIPVYTALHVN